MRLSSQDIRDSIEDILVELQDEKVPYDLKVYNDDRKGWSGWEIPTIRLNIDSYLDTRFPHKNKIVLDAIEHLSLYIKDLGYDENSLHKYSKSWSGKPRKAKYNKNQSLK